MKPAFFFEGHNLTVASAVKKLLNNSRDFLTEFTEGSTRGIGDAVETIVSQQFGEILGDWCKEYSSSFSRRAMADLAFKDRDNFYCVVDVKTHRSDTKFNMPNLTSVERLSRFYEDDQNVFSLLLIKYSIKGLSISVETVHFVPIEFLNWSCLTIGALGWGQIQIANSNNLSIAQGFSRKEWMLSLCDALEAFYPKEILKIQNRISRFEDVKTYWMSKPDLWS